MSRAKTGVMNAASTSAAPRSPRARRLRILLDHTWVRPFLDSAVVSG